METIRASDLSTWTGRVVDVRGYDEFKAERLAKAECVPLDRLAVEAAGWDRDQPILLMCKSGMRSGKAMQQMRQMGFSRLVMLEGGIESCKQAGVEVVREGRYIPLYRQVMIAAGLLLLVGLLAAQVNPWFLLVDAFVACGLVLGGLTGYCPMAGLLGKMPWNSSESSCCAVTEKR